MGRGAGAETTLRTKISKPAPSRIFNCRFPGEEQYEVVCKIGKGSYGTVVKARSRGTGEDVAIKHIDRVFSDPADTVRIIRELRFLRMLKHPAIVGVSTVLHPANPARFDDIFIVTELLDSDLSQLTRRRESITPAQKRWLVYQLFEGLAYMHAAHVYHRDLKPANLLVSAPDAVGLRTLKLCDFGLARASFEDSTGGAAVAGGDREEGPVLWTDYVATRWYRAPELICSYRGGSYDGSIDVWAAGCIMAELWRGRALFPARNMYHQLDLITAFVGTPSAAMIEQLRNKKAKTYLASLKTREPSNWGKAFSEKDVVGEEAECGLEDAFELLRSLLCLNPVRRTDARAALQHCYFADCTRRRVGGGASPQPVPIVQPRREDFSFESKEHKLSVAELRGTLHREILHFSEHPYPASPNFAPISSAQVKTQMKVLSLDESSGDLGSLPGRKISASSSMPGPQMAQLAAGTISGGSAAAVDSAPPPTTAQALRKCPTSAGPPSLARSSSPTRAAAAAAAAAAGTTAAASHRRSPLRGRGRSRSPARCRSSSRSPSRSANCGRPGTEAVASSTDACESQLSSIEAAKRGGGMSAWDHMAYDVAMFGDLSTIGMPLTGSGSGCPTSPFSRSSAGSSATGVVHRQQRQQGRPRPTTPDRGRPSERPPPSPDASGSTNGVGKAFSSFFDRMMAVRTMAYATGYGMHADAAEWVPSAEPGYAFV
jgi:serine/threonine protein kinase